MALKLVQTTISGATIRLRYADSEDHDKATEWIDLQFSASDLNHPSAGSALGDLEPQFLAEIRGAVLRRARDVIDAEIRRLRDRPNP
jgi:hypothetical protein